MCSSGLVVLSCQFSTKFFSSTDLCGIQITALNLVGTTGTTCVTVFSHLVLYLPPYSINHRYAVSSVNIECTDSWLNETTVIGPKVVSEVSSTLPFNFLNLGLGVRQKLAFTGSLGYNVIKMAL